MALKKAFEKLLVFIDGSEESIDAAKYSIILSKLYKCDILALYVVDTAALKELLVSRIFIEEESMEHEQALMEDGKKYLKYVNELAEKKGIKVDTYLEKGSTYGKILEMSVDKSADMIVIGGKKSGFRDRDVVSVEIRKLINSSKMPILIVRGENIDRDYNRL